MNALAALLVEPWMQRLGWVLLHFIWQGTAIALLLAMTLPLLARTSSHLRYMVIGGSLLLCGIVPVVTWTILDSPSEPSLAPATTPTLIYATDIKVAVLSPSPSFPRKILLFPSEEDGIAWGDNFREAASTALPYLVCIWFGGVSISFIRLTLGWTLIRRLYRSGFPIQDSSCLKRFRHLLVRMQVGNPVRLLQSTRVEVPMLIGWLRPTILVPALVFTGLSPDQLDAILAHELAHVRRYDYLVNLLQTVLETILFYHPAVWWISRKLREERENCCDDIALEVMQDRVVYVSALARLEEGRALPLALSISGGSLLKRIKRIANAEQRKTSLMPVIIVALILGFLAVPLIAQIAEKTVKIDEGIYKTRNLALTEALVAAAKRGDSAEVERLLKQRADPNTMVQSDGMNALFAAVHGDHLDTVRLLLQNGAYPNGDPGNPDVFALSYAKNAAMVKLLLDGGADPNGKNRLITPLMDAPDSESVRLLVKHGAKLNPKLNDGRALLEHAVADEIYERELGDRWDVINELIKQGAEFDPKGNGPTLLVLAAGEGKINIARGLIDAGVSPDAYATRGIFLVSPLTEAAFARSPDMIKLLLSRGAHLSACRGNTSPLSMALDSGRYDNASALRQAGENDVGYFSEYCARGNLAKVNELLWAGANVNETDTFGVTPLIYAIRQGHPEIVKLLFEHGANINQFNLAGTTPFGLFQDLLADFNQYPGAMQDDWGIPGRVHAAEAKRRMADLESFFRQHPPNPNYQNVSGYTALHQAALAGNTGDLGQLLALRPDVNLKDNNGNTPLLLAALSPLASNLAIRYIDKASAKEWNAEARIADQLIKAGAKLNIVLANGKTVGEAAMAAAMRAKNLQLISVLHEAGVAEALSPPKSSNEAIGMRASDAGTSARGAEAGMIALL